MNVNRRNVLLGFGAVPLVLAGCGGNSGGDSGTSTPTFAAKGTVDNLTDNVIVPTYSDLNARAADLIAAVTALSTDLTSESKMDAAQAAWIATRVNWESSEGFLFGPVDALGIDPSIDSWPLDTNQLQDFLDANPNATQADIENSSDDLRGFHAIEYLLFGDGTSDNDKAASELTAPEGKYLVALAQAFKVRVNLLETSWTTAYGTNGPFQATLKTPGLGQTYTGYGAVIEELLSGIAGIADEVGNAKMAEPLGTSVGTADTSKVESQYSWNSLTDFHNNIQSVMNIYTGKRGFNWATDTVAVAQKGLYAFVNTHDATLATRVVTEIADLQKKIALIKGDGDDKTTVVSGTAKPFREQIKTTAGRALITTAIAAANTLLATLDTNVRPLIAKTSFTA